MDPMELYEVRQTSRRWWQTTCVLCLWLDRARSQEAAEAAGQRHISLRHRRGLTKEDVQLAA